MSVILQMHFDKEGPFGEEYGQDCAKSINDKPSFIWKIWIEIPDEKPIDYIYLFI